MPSYEYSLDGGPFQTPNSFTGLAAGVFELVMRDANGCLDTVSTTVIEPTPLSGIDSLEMIDCNGASNGEIYINAASGGTLPIQFSIDGGGSYQLINSFLGLSAGTYSVLLQDGNGCQDSLTGLIITEPAALSFADSSLNVLCDGEANGEIHLSGSGGTPGYMFSLDGATAVSSSSYTGLTAGSYSVEVFDANGCSQTLPAILISEPSALSLSISTIQASCGNSDGEATATPAGGTSGYTISWPTLSGATGATQTGLSGGIYPIVITDANGCTLLDTALISELNAPEISMDGLATVACFGDADGFAFTSVDAGGTAPFTYAWAAAPGATSDTLTGLGAGVYVVTVTDDLGCTDIDSFSISEPAALVVVGDATRLPVLEIQTGQFL